MCLALLFHSHQYARVGAIHLSWFLIQCRCSCSGMGLCVCVCATTCTVHKLVSMQVLVHVTAPPHPLHFLLPTPYISSSPSLTFPPPPAYSRQLADLCVDDRAAVRKSASQTLFSTISAHGTLLCQETWHEVLAPVSAYVCTCVVCVCLCVECVHMTNDSLSFHGITVA